MIHAFSLFFSECSIHDVAALRSLALAEEVIINHVNSVGNGCVSSCSMAAFTSRLRFNLEQIALFLLNLESKRELLSGDIKLLHVCRERSARSLPIRNDKLPAHGSRGVHTIISSELARLNKPEV